MGIFAIVPGFPPLVFGLLAILTGGGAWLQTRNRRRALEAGRSQEMPALAPALAPAGTTPKFPDDEKNLPPIEPVSFALTVPLIVDIASSVRNSIRPEKLDREVAKVRRALYFDLGVPFPASTCAQRQSSAGEYRILVNEIPVATGLARPGFVIVRESEANLKMFDIPSSTATTSCRTRRAAGRRQAHPHDGKGGDAGDDPVVHAHLPSRPRAEGACGRVRRHPGNHVPDGPDAEELRRTAEGGDAPAADRHHHGRPAAPRQRGDLHPRHAHDPGGAGLLGAAREGSDHADRARAQCSQPLHHAQVLGRPERAAGLSPRQGGGGHHPRRGPPDLRCVLPRPLAGRAPRTHRLAEGRRRPRQHAHDPAGHPGAARHPPLHAQDRGARFPDLAVLSYQELTPSATVQPLDRIKIRAKIEAA